MKYKVGDKVRIKSLDWYNENKDDDGIVELSTHVFIPEMIEHCGRIVTIKDVFEDTVGNAVYYYMEEIVWDWTDEMIEGLTERNGKTYPYKIGDRVILKGKNRCATITDLKYNSWGNLSYYIKIDNDKDISIDYPTDLLLPYDNMIEGLVEEETKVGTALNPIELKSNANCLTRERVDELAIKIDKELPSGNQNVWELPEGYQFTDENGNVINATKIVLEKKPKYPQTYEECLEIMGVKISDCYIQGYKAPLFEDLQQLIICRDAYWKIAGEEMGLGKPWEPNFKQGEGIKYTIFLANGEVIWNRQECICTTGSRILAFPTKEVRDAFYEAFKELIEECKELL